MSFFSPFKYSPVFQLRQHMQKVNTCVQILQPFFEAVICQNWDKAAELQKKISEIEQEADRLKRDLRLQLPRGLFSVIPRQDILALLNLQDALANQAQDIAGLTYGRQMHIPDSFQEFIREFIQQCLIACKQAEQAIDEVDSLFVSGFSGKETSIIEAMITKLHGTEQTTDSLQIKIKQKLFKKEDDFSPVEVIFFYKLIDAIGSLADFADDIGARLQLLLAQ